MADQRLYGKFTLNFPQHPKIAILSDAAFRCLVEATLYSREQLTDGLLARRYAVARWSLEVLQELCTNADENPSLIECDNGWYIHDYAEHQDTKADVEARRERNKRAGQIGGQASAKQRAKPVAKRSAKRTVNGFQPETETETETSLLVTKNGGVTSRNAHARNGADAPPPQCKNHPNPDHPKPCRPCQLVREYRDGAADRAEQARVQALREREQRDREDARAKYAAWAEEQGAQL